MSENKEPTFSLLSELAELDPALRDDFFGEPTECFFCQAESHQEKLQPQALPSYVLSLEDHKSDCLWARAQTYRGRGESQKEES